MPLPPALRRLQRLWVVFLLIAVGILAVLPFFDAEPSEIPVALTATLAAAGGIGSFIAVVAIDLTFAGSPPASDRRALQEFEARVTLGFVLAQAPAVLGFALAFVFGQLLPAVIGGGLAIVCLLRARPGRGRIERLETQWHAAGADVSVLRAAAAPTVAGDPAEPPDGPEPPEGPEPPGSDRTGERDGAEPPARDRPAEPGEPDRP